jgi:transcriptional regulator GlxA family with amidase domain
MAAMKETTRTVFQYLQEHTNEDLTAADLSEILGMEKRQVDGIFTAAIQRKNYGYREEVEVELNDGSHQKIKLLRLNEDGQNLNLDGVE